METPSTSFFVIAVQPLVVPGILQILSLDQSDLLAANQFKVMYGLADNLRSSLCRRQKLIDGIVN
ncbi:hypothetical protein KP509_19G062600 [Ceratopteris richardii]|uniref:Uncharacterized protein n=1 Tax=Ceratopteris richardii TaxID=49495 RepID=A0A8T2SKR7_CERRI|nr:hypothetical protein KP509_19G062600 [Ceratopteris richardii]